MALLQTHFYARSLQQSVGMNIILPERSEAWKTPPAVLYLLHGLSGDHTSWIRRSSIERYVMDLNLVVVMPDAHKSFYTDMAHGSDYWTFFSEELPARISQWFRVSNTWKNTFVAGTSMGGYGAVKLALGRPDLFSHAASLSGALDLAAHINDDWDEPRLRTFGAVFDSIEKVPESGNDLIHAVRNLETIPDTEFYVCCGVDDWLHPDSVRFREAASEKGLYLTYEESAGAHKWDYWDAAIRRVLEWLPVEPLSPTGS
ncbi:alpha/beta hydrolase [Pontiella agarivorans]|uniref:Alpha/beta hydrolase family protein n=1 Tax=Pontiella agarivorans TaxID=3038953 RepID=A0ABU5MSN4_9BACT|nr:alpha/beta hydrolase family protein [Pontiella agarivorans]MDZ8117106.1 alpha/beta hydrolase family protein [Pontiella agarivorans]